jgi:eukaryotic-like serine/threonine-protein kinase
LSDPIGQDESHPLPLPLARLVDDVCGRFEAAWKAAAGGGEPPRLEAYLAEAPAAAHAVLLRELLQIEAHHRRQGGDEPHDDDYLDRLPGLDPDWLAAVLRPAEPQRAAGTPVPAYETPGGLGRGASAASEFGRRVPTRARNSTARMPAGEITRTQTLNQFVDALRRSELLDPQQTQALLTQAGVARQPEDLAAWLVARGWLTAYQASKLLAGRPDELILGSYRLMEPLGEGGMGQVFKARHLLMNRVVAVKLIHPAIVNDPSAVQRFRGEIRAAAQLNHPNVVVAHDAEEAGGRHFLVMEFCEGMTLRRLVDEAGPLPVEAACEYVRQAALGLQHAFERGLIHRDVKPANLMLGGATVKILDLGLARLRSRDVSSSSATKEGEIVGTPDFMAPEQAEGRPDVRSDLYSLGCTFYYLLTGRPPFPGGSLIEKCLRHRSEEPEPLERQRPDVPAPVRQIVRRLMAKNPGDRFQSPEELAAALAPFAQVGPPRGAPDHTGGSFHRPETSGGVPAASSSLEPKAPQRTLVLTPRPRRAASRSRRVAAGLGAALAVALVGVGIFLAMRKGGEPDPHDPPEKRQPPRPRTWKKSNELPVPPGHASAYGLAFSPDSRLLAAGFGNNEDSGPRRPGRVRVYEVAAGWREVLDKEVESGPVTCLAFSPDGKRLAWGAGSWIQDAPGHVTLWGVADQTVKAPFEAHPKGVWGMAFQPRGDLLVTSGREGKVRLWGGERGERRGELKDARAPVLALAFSPDGERLAIGSDDGSVDLWEVSTRKPLGPLARAPGKPVRGLAFSADGETILAVTKRGEGATADLLAWDWRDRRAAPPIPLGETEAYCLAISPDRATFVAGCQNKTAKLFQTATRRELQTLEGDRAFLCVAFSPDGRRLATSGGWFGPVQLWVEAE